MVHFKLEGIVAAPFLPMLPDFSIDWTSLRSYIRWIAQQTPTAIAMNMDASEGPSLEHDEQLEVLRVCKDVIGGAVPHPGRRAFPRSSRPTGRRSSRPAWRRSGRPS